MNNQQFAQFVLTELVGDLDSLTASLSEQNYSGFIKSGKVLNDISQKHKNLKNTYGLPNILDFYEKLKKDGNVSVGYQQSNQVHLLL